MNPLAPVSEIMSLHVITASPNDTLLNIKHIVSHHKIHHVPIVEEGVLVGMVSRTDLLKIGIGLSIKASNQDELDMLYQAIPVRTVMTEKLAKVAPTERIDVVALILQENRFHALPVVENGALVGIVTTFDLIRYAYKLTQVAWK